MARPSLLRVRNLRCGGGSVGNCGNASGKARSSCYQRKRYSRRHLRRASRRLARKESVKHRAGEKAASAKTALKLAC